MRFAFIEKWKFKMFGRSMPVIKVSEVEKDGRINSLQIVGHIKKRANSLIKTWDAEGYEIPSGQSPIAIINDVGHAEIGFVVCNGKTTDIYVKPQDAIAMDTCEITGKYATADDIADALDAGKSMRNIVLGVILGAPLWWMVFIFLGAAIA